MSISLSKEQSLVRLEKRTKEVSEVVKVNLTKYNLNPDTKARVAFVIDISGSMEPAYKKGSVQEIVEKIFPIAINFDDNAEMDVWIFEDGFRRMPAMNKDNYYGYVQREILDKKCKFGGTSYAPVLKDVAKYYLEEKPEPSPVYVIFITDGDNFDKSETTKVVKELSNYPIFLQFVGVGNAGFDYLEKLDDMGGRYIDNADFFKVTYNDFYIENNLYGQLLQEYPNWLSDDRVKDMIQNNFKREPKNEPKKKGFFGLFS